LQRCSVWKVYIYRRRLLNVWKVWANFVYKDISVFTERILKSVASALQNFHKTLYIVFDKRSGNIQTQQRCISILKVWKRINSQKILIEWLSTFYKTFYFYQGYQFYNILCTTNKLDKHHILSLQFFKHNKTKHNKNYVNITLRLECVQTVIKT